MAEYHIFVVSDGTAETATKMSKAALLQFKPENTVITRHNNIRTSDSIHDVVRAAESARALIIHTFASRELRHVMEEHCRKRNVPSHDLLGLLLDKLEEFIGAPPTGKPGLLHQVDDGYFERVEALAFALRNDDKRCPEELKLADIVLVGASRTSKTPISIYLAQEGLRVANVPLVLGENLCPELEGVDPGKVLVLLTTSERLIEVRKARLSRLDAKDSSYADFERVAAELEYCRRTLENHPGWRSVDVAGKSIEESAADILDMICGKGRRV